MTLLLALLLKNMHTNQVIHGDCLEVMKDIPDKSIDMILCDLPYGTTSCKWDTIIPFEPLWEQYKRIIKDNGAIVLTASQPFTSALVMSNPDWYRHEWIWEKERGANFMQANKQPNKVHENVLVFGKKAPLYYPIKTKNSVTRKRTDELSVVQSRKEAGLNVERFKSSEKYDGKLLLPRSIQKFNRDNATTKGGSLHPTQKPVALFEYLIRTYTNEGYLVLDNCAGSGTTGVACKNLNRNYILIEKEPEYIDIINKRLTQDTNPKE
jgi:site-specific DNA-methyltransferase (adenine-specific)